jgi:hypothetical protein
VEKKDVRVAKDLLEFCLYKEVKSKKPAKKARVAEDESEEESEEEVTIKPVRSRMQKKEKEIPEDEFNTMEDNLFNKVKGTPMETQLSHSTRATGELTQGDLSGVESLSVQDVLEPR